MLQWKQTVICISSLIKNIACYSIVISPIFGRIFLHFEKIQKHDHLPLSIHFCQWSPSK